MKKLVCAAAMVAALVTPAAALAAKPVPCGPLAVEDPAGDQQMHVPQIGVPTGQDADPLTDFTGFFFRGDGSKVTGNMMISELSQTIPDPATGVRWTLYYTVGEQAYWARAILTEDGLEYIWGTEAATGTLTEEGTMKGEFHEGKDGLISFVLPAAAGGKPGTRITAASAIAAYQFPQGAGSSADFMPDEDEFEATVPTCPAGSEPPPTTGTTPPPSEPAPAPAPGGSQPAPSTTPGATQSDFRVAVKPTALKAKKLKKGKAITFTLSSGETLTALRATLLKGKKALGSGKLARLAGSGKLKLKPKAKLKKGSYVLVITAKRADGTTGTIGVPIKVR